MEEAATRAKPKAVALLSGGLDSTLAVKLMLDQGVEVVALNFVSPFCTCSPRRMGSCHLASAVAARLGVRIRRVSKGLDYLKIVERPKFGYGRGMNPCIDCRIFMFKKAREIMEEERAQFIVTGEVLGQRPMSQRRQAIELIERESGLTDLIVRPLSAQWFRPTLPERNGWVDRAMLLDIRGRSRARQLALARDRDVDLYGCPSGGCRLTDPVIAGRLRDLFRFSPDYDMRDVRLLTLGRHFRIHPGLKVVLGRNQAENDVLRRIGAEWPRLEITGVPGPVLLIRGTVRDEDQEILVAILRHFTPKEAPKQVTLSWTCGEQSRIGTAASREGNRDVKCWRI